MCTSINVRSVCRFVHVFVRVRVCTSVCMCRCVRVRVSIHSTTYRIAYTQSNKCLHDPAWHKLG